MQRIAFKDFPKLKEFALSNVGAVDTREQLTAQLVSLRRAVYWSAHVTNSTQRQRTA